jgi:hypothetical protein
MNKPSNNQKIGKNIFRAGLLVTAIALLATGAFAQETGGELGGGAGIFRPKNPTAKRSGGPPKAGSSAHEPGRNRSEFSGRTR